MTTFIFVNGTRVLQSGYDETFKLIKEKVGKLRPHIKILPRFWSENLTQANINKLP